MAANDTPQVFVDGLEPVFENDLGKFRGVLERFKVDYQTFRDARAHEVKKKRHYEGLVGNGKWDDVRLKASIKDINQNINHFEKKIKLANDGIEHYTLVVEDLEKNYKEYKARHNGNADRLV